MATFEKNMNSNNVESEIQKFALKRLEPHIKKFTEVIDININRLNQHRNNIEKFKQKRDWTSLNSENIKAITTVQQVQANIKEIDNTRNRVADKDVVAFDKKVSHVKQKALTSIDALLYPNTDTPLEESGSSCSSLTSSICRSNDSSLTDSVCKSAGSDLMVTNSINLPSITTVTSTTDSHGSETVQHLLGDQLLLERPVEVPDDCDAAVTYASLQQNLLELSGLIHDFAVAVEAQKEPLDNITNNIETAQMNVSEGVKHVSKASKYASAMIPVAGAAIGLVIGGPIGLLAGAKLGALAAFVTGGTGFVAGKFIKRQQDKITNIEMENLSKPEPD